MESVTYEDIKIYSNDWIDVFESSTLLKSDNVTIQNKSVNGIVVAVSSTKPDPESYEGISVKIGESIRVNSGVGIWVKLESPKSLTESHITVYKTEINDKSYSLNGSNSQSVDFESKQAMNTVFGEQTVAQRNDWINIQFQYNVSVKDVDISSTGTGYVSHAGESRAQVGTGTGVGTASIQSIDAIRYIAGKEMVANFTCDFSQGEVNTYQYSGVLDNENGFAVGFNGASFGMIIRRGGIDTFTPYSQFNLKPSWFILDPTGYYIYKISYGWLGVAPAILSVYAGHLLGWISLHVIDNTSEEAPHILNPVLPIRMEVGRTSGTGNDMFLRTSSWRGGIVGTVTAGGNSDRTHQLFVRNKTVPGGNILTPLVSIRNTTTFQGVTNHVRVRYGTVSLSTDGTKDVIITVFRGGTLTGGTWVDYDTENSVSQYNITATAYDPGVNNRAIGGTLLGKVDKVRINLFADDVVIPVRPGETVTLCADSSNSTVMNVFLRHIEEF